MNQTTRRVAIIGGNRIPFARSNSVYANASNQDMLTTAIDGLVARFGIEGERLGEVARHVAETRERLVAMVAAARLAAVPEDRRADAAVQVEALSTAVLGAAEALARWWLRTDSMTAADVADLLITNLRAR